jgi:DNA-binding transcriptional MerR regulator
MSKSPDAFRTIREVADWLGVAAHVLRFWESKFTQIKPVKRAGGRRYYRPADMELVGGIKVLLHDRGMTVRGVQRMLREEGVATVAALSPPLDAIAVPSELLEGIADEAAWHEDGPPRKARKGRARPPNPRTPSAPEPEPARASRCRRLRPPTTGPPKAAESGAAAPEPSQRSPARARNADGPTDAMQPAEGGRRTGTDRAEPARTR